MGAQYHWEITDVFLRCFSPSLVMIATGLLETFARDRADPAAVTDNSQVPVWLLSFSGGEELC